MRRLSVCVGVLLFALAVVVSAQAPIIGPTDAIAFDYSDQDYFDYAVQRFEAAYDGGAFTFLQASQYQTVSGVSSYKFVPPQTSGTHSVVLRACNTGGCGVGSSPFAFALPTSSSPSAPANLRKVPR